MGRGAGLGRHTGRPGGGVTVSSDTAGSALVGPCSLREGWMKGIAVSACSTALSSSTTPSWSTCTDINGLMQLDG